VEPGGVRHRPAFPFEWEVIMPARGYSQSYITDKRIDFAVRLADDIAARDLSLTAYECAERAVRRIFGRWLLEATGLVPAPQLALYYRLVDEVEQRLGLHRRRPQPFRPWPAQALAEPHAASVVA
jgi:hypothetical protein